MKPLEPPDSHCLSAAIGWLGLGNVAEASVELEKIAPQFQSHPDVLAVRFDIHAAAGKWDAAAEIAGTLTRLEPKEPGAWISLAYATRRKAGGGIPQARTILIQAQRTFSMVPIRCRRTGTSFLYSVWDGRFGQLAFECLHCMKVKS